MSELRGTSSASRWLIVAAWAGVAVLTAILLITKYSAAIAADPTDGSLEIFIEAARLEASGGDPYDAAALGGSYLTGSYTYSPLVAWALMPFLQLGLFGQIWTAFCLLCGVVAVAAVTATLWPRLTPWGRVLVAAVGIVTLDYNEVVNWELLDGQSQLPVLATTALAVFFAARTPAVSGVMLALGALVKTWPAMFGLWILRAHNPNRRKELLGAIGTAVVFVGIMILVDGPNSIAEWVQRTLDLREQPLQIYSVWFFERELFAGSADPVAADAAPLAGRIVSWTLAVIVLALLVLALRRPGEPGLAMWNVVAATLLLLPVSHHFYQLILLPILWHWLGIALAERRKPDSWALVGLMALWWLVAFRFGNDGDPLVSSFVIVTLTVLVYAASVLLAARRDPLGLRLRRRPVEGPAATASADEAVTAAHPIGVE
ncbi:glycosyltransferase family 87 protein [Agromyces seonyuensis]|uniref:DUF2029 domain-containing protein n=1 Tax=Agromyces seonyuensis TaxID=2662446 RepID=A0A6I4P1Z6_9MICO|nr:glycosyltransferase family 87 protein [Agromyces seonyuensis]MWB97267.1 DUF2029 domain-containing protein [Agromyces seonyuensis]